MVRSPLSILTAVTARFWALVRVPVVVVVTWRAPTSKMSESEGLDQRSSRWPAEIPAGHRDNRVKSLQVIPGDSILGARRLGAVRFA